MRILILEDDPFIALDLQMIVEAGGHIASTCDSVREARQRLDDAIDFALLDVDVRDGKSFGLGTVLQEQGIPFAFVSGSRQGDVPPHLRDAAFIAKPFLEGAILACLPAAACASRRPPELSAARPAA